MLDRWVALLGLVAFACLALLEPVNAASTDLWYHLAGGRYLFETGQLYNPYVVSFLTPQEHFTNYFWGFQVAVYSLWLIVGDYAPILLRTLLVLPCAYFMLRTLCRDDLTRMNIVHMVLAMLLLYMLSVRLGAVRPHLATLMFISAFLYILMHRKLWFPVLPLLAILWVNLHGVGWAIGAVICGSYFLAQLIYKWQQDKPLDKSLWWVVSCGPAILVNPWGVYVLPTPFLTERSLSLLISELTPLELNLNWPLADGLAFHPTIVILLGFYFVALISLRKRWLEYLFPLLISVASFALFLRGQRFIWECMLLCVPLLAIYAARFDQLSWARGTARVGLLTTAILLYSMTSVHSDEGSYPIGDQYPEGTTQFLKALELNTSYALPPTLAGFAEWHLTPGYTIHSDMHFPPFTAAVHFEVHSIQNSAVAFERFVAKHSPGLVSVRRSSTAFADIARSQNYTPIFFDRHLALYASIQELPQVVAEYGLTAVDPFDPFQVAGNFLDVATEELQRVLRFDPQNEEARIVLSDLLIESNQLELAEEVLTPGIVNENPKLQFQRGKLLLRQEQYQQAADLLAIAYNSVADPAMGLVAADAAFLAERPEEAYLLYEEILNPYLDAEYDVVHLYQYALAGLVIGEVRRAKDLYDVLKVVNGHSETVDLSTLANLLEELE